MKDLSKDITPKLLRELLNKEEDRIGIKGKTASSRARGAKTSKAGDYMYRQDRGAFDALLADIQHGENKSMWENLKKIYMKESLVHLKTFQLFEMAAMPTGMPKTYFHGTSSEEAGKKILEEGYLKPGNTSTTRGQKLTPMMNYVYCTPDIRTACIYTIGGVFMGTDAPMSGRPGNKPSQFGYCFEIDQSELKDVKPDEDFVGELIWFLASGKNAHYMAEGEDSYIWKKVIKWSQDNPYNASRFIDFAKGNLTELQYRKCVRYDDYADFAVAGKKLNKVMGSAMQQEIMSLGCPVANLGAVKISGAWRLDKTRTKELDKDASNFFNVAKKIDI